MDPRLLEPEVQETIRSTLASMQASLERMMAACNDMRELTKMNPIRSSEFSESIVDVGSVNSDDEDGVQDMQSDNISSLQDNNINNSVIVSVESLIESLVIQAKGNHSPNMFLQHTQMDDDIILNVSSQIVTNDAIFLNDFYWPTARESFHLSESDGNMEHCNYLLSGIENFTKPVVTMNSWITLKEWPPPAIGSHLTDQHLNIGTPNHLCGGTIKRVLITQLFPSMHIKFKNDNPAFYSRQVSHICSNASVSSSGSVMFSWFKLLCMCILRKYMLPVMIISLNISVRITPFGNTEIRKLVVESLHVRMLLFFAGDSNLGTRCDEIICICWFIKSLVIANSGNSVSEYTRISNEFLPRLPIIDACYFNPLSTTAYYSTMIFTPTSRVVQSVREYILNSYSFKDGISDGTATLRRFLKCFHVWLYYKGWGFYNAKTVSQIIWHIAWVPSLLDQFTGIQSPFLTERYSCSLCTLSRRGLAFLLRTFDGSLSFPMVLYPLTMLIVLVDFLTTQCAWTVIPCGQAWIVRGCLGLVSHFYWAKRQGVSIAHKQWSSETHVCQGQLVFLLWTDVKLYLVSAPNSHGLNYLFSFCSQCARHFRFHNFITSLTSIHSILGSQRVNIKDIMVTQKMLILRTVWNSRLYNNPSHLHSNLMLQPKSDSERNFHALTAQDSDSFPSKKVQRLGITLVELPNNALIIRTHNTLASSIGYVSARRKQLAVTFYSMVISFVLLVTEGSVVSRLWQIAWGTVLEFLAANSDRYTCLVKPDFSACTLALDQQVMYYVLIKISTGDSLPIWEWTVCRLVNKWLVYNELQRNDHPLVWISVQYCATSYFWQYYTTYMSGISFAFGMSTSFVFLRLFIRTFNPGIASELSPGNSLITELASLLSTFLFYEICLRDQQATFPARSYVTINIMMFVSECYREVNVYNEVAVFYFGQSIHYSFTELGYMVFFNGIVDVQLIESGFYGKHFQFLWALPSVVILWMIAWTVGANLLTLIPVFDKVNQQFSSLHNGHKQTVEINYCVGLSSTYPKASILVCFVYFIWWSMSSFVWRIAWDSVTIWTLSTELSLRTRIVLKGKGVSCEWHVSKSTILICNGLGSITSPIE